MTDRIIYQNSELYYYREGAGDKVILLFHGFGQDHRAFESWNEALKNDYSIYTFDLYFHGNSNWANPQAVKKEDWKNIFQLFLDQEKIGSFEIAGFSIGARFVLATIELFPERVKKVILLAPDGIDKNLWYGLATGTSLMRTLFRSMILKPKRLIPLLKIVKLFNLEDKSLLRFAEFQLSTEEKRLRVYNSWIYFRHLNFNLKRLWLPINSRNIPVIFISGKSDKVIPTKKIEGFAMKLSASEFHLIDADHNNLLEKAIVKLSN